MSVPFKIIKKGSEARDALVKGANYLADCTKVTLGPWGENWFLEKKNRITNDGVTIAREIEVRDEIENRGVIALREAAIKQNDEVGDGTTTAIALAQAILNEIVKLIGSGRTIASKETPAEIRVRLEKERVEVTEKLIAMSKTIESEEQLINSAIVSVEDKALGEIIGKAQWKLGKDGELLAEEVNERECSVEFVNGVKLDNGFSTSLSINNPEKQSLELNGAHVLLTNFVFNESVGLQPILDVMKQLYKTGVRHVILFGRAFSQQSFKDMKANAELGYFIYPINAPYQDQNEVMKDLEAVLGGTYINTEAVDISNAQLSDFGVCEKIVARRYSANITGKKDDAAKERIARRVDDLEKQLKGSQSEFEKKTLRVRIAQLTVGSGIIKIGAQSETERGYKKDKADDAVNAVRVALQEGVVPGAGLAFKTISESLPEGYILKKPLLCVYEQIMSTAPMGFEVPAWVMDPTRVLRIALEKACSVAGTFATAGGANATEREKPRYVQEAIQAPVTNPNPNEIV